MTRSGQKEAKIKKKTRKVRVCGVANLIAKVGAKQGSHYGACIYLYGSTVKRKLIISKMCMQKYYVYELEEV